jgi:predicted alpha/beta superfamily hydrolase
VPAPFASEDREVTNPDTGHRYLVQVERPNRYHRDGARRFPLVVCLDGLWTYGVVRDAFRILPLSRELPEAVVVGVSHAEADLRDALQVRAVDFTPTQALAPAPTGVRLGAEAVGQAARFRRFLLEEIVAGVAARHRVSDDRTLVGHSFSGLFGLDTLLEGPDAFDRWVLASPSVWWDDRVMFRREAAHAAAGRPIGGRLFLSTGDEEGEGLGGHEAFYRQLASRHYPDLQLHWARFPGETHQSVIATALVRGLRLVFR